MVLRHKVFSVLVAVALVVSAHGFFEAHQAYTALQNRLHGLTSEVRSLERRREQLAHNRRLVEQSRDFVDQAVSLGLTKAQWSSYHVNIDEPVSFQEAEYILNQTVNSPSYYFRPSMLHIKAKAAADMQETPSGHQKTAVLEQGDLLITLKGDFVVKRR